MNSIRPAKENIAAREHVNVARRVRICFKLFFFGILFLHDQFRFMSLSNISKKLEDFTSLAKNVK